MSSWLIPKWVKDLSDAALTAIKKVWAFIKVIWQGGARFVGLIVDIFTGDVIETFGYSPYLALPGMLTIPLQYFIPDFFDGIFGFVGVDASVLTMYQTISSFYLIALSFYNFAYGGQLTI